MRPVSRYLSKSFPSSLFDRPGNRWLNTSIIALRSDESARTPAPFARSKLVLVSAVALSRSAVDRFGVVRVNRFGGVRGVGVPGRSPMRILYVVGLMAGIVFRQGTEV
jgi:hypothetical protein